MRVGAEGPRTATLAIVAEKPGAYELAQNRPLIGPTGQEVNDLLYRVGLSRNQVYLTNAVKTVTTLETPTDIDIKAEQLELYRELGSMPNLQCILALGNVALLALSNFQLDAITRRRGSIYMSFIRRKMVPTMHPSYYLHGDPRAGGSNWRFKPVIQFDFARALEESNSSKIRLPQRDYYIEPSFKEALSWLKSFKGKKYISFDIELLRNRTISCMAFSHNPNMAVCIPFCKQGVRNYWSIEEEAAIWRAIQSILQQPNTIYVTQNGMFDCWHLWRHGITTPYMSKGLDTMYMHKLRAPDLPHSLEFLVSIYTDPVEPYYKDESGEWDSEIRVPDKQFWIYNCKDAACTLEVADDLAADLESLEMLGNYRSEVQPQWDVLMSMEQHGIKVNLDRLRQVRSKLIEELNTCESNLKSSIGWIPNTKSHSDMKKFFSELKITPDLTPSGRVKIDEERFFMYANRYPEARAEITGCIDINRRRTLLSGFLGFPLDSKGFYHPKYKLTHTKTGRLASEGSDDGGPQLQNIPASLRHIFVPDDPDSEITSGDLKQAEAMIVTWDAEDPLRLKAFSEDKDIHRVMACVIFRDWNSSELPPDDLLSSILESCRPCFRRGILKCNHSERYIAKQSNHAFAYKMGTRKFISLQREQGVFLNEKEANRIRDLCVTPAIRAWQESIHNTLRQSPWIQNPLGRKREFYGLLDEDMVRAALSWIPQSTVSQITNLAMIRLHNAFQQFPSNSRPRIINQLHDSVTITHKQSLRTAVSQILRDAFSHEMVIHGRTLTIPLEVSHGSSWGELKESKEL